MMVFFFFFQAEDGIRDYKVTGVQTCALPICALATACRALSGWRPITAGVAATLGGAAIFSAFHYIGPYGDRLQLYSFLFRMIAGVFFSALYLVRGFGITAWTHALYDVSLLLLQ